MGEDGADLIRTVEDAFQIHIADEAAGNVSTVGELCNLVLDKLQGQHSKRCLTSSAFYRTRRGIVDVAGIDRREIRPSTALAIIFPRNGRREKWRRIQESMKLKLPDLQHPAWLASGLLACGVALVAVPGLYAGLGYGWIAISFLIGLAVGGFLITLSPFLAVAFPNRDTTVGDLARDVLALNHARLAGDAGGWNKKDVWESLCRLIVMQTNVAREKVRPEASIVDDLGID